jgi:hypothetical protein
VLIAMRGESTGDCERPNKGARRSRVMFEQATGVADERHRSFFDRTGEVRQVWARRSDGSLFYLADGGVNEQIRAAARDGQLSCPYPNCPDPRFIARGGHERRHHFAHRVASQEHQPTAVWRHQALLMLADWCSRTYPQIRIELDDRSDAGSMSLHSPHTGRTLTLTVTYDRRYQPSTPSPGHQVLLGHARALLLPRPEPTPTPRQWWCGAGRLVSDITSLHGWALAINPQERLIGTLVDGYLARSAGLIRGPVRAPVLCIVDEIDTARLDAEGLHTPTSDAIAKELQRRRVREVELEQRRIEAEAAAAARLTVGERMPLDRRRHRDDVHVTMPSDDAPTGSDRWKSDGLVGATRDWPRDPQALRLLLGDDELARRLEQPLSSDVKCDVPSAIWHLMVALELRKRGGVAHPLAIRAEIATQGCGYTLTRDAIVGVIDVIENDS